jgi:hypothetical protein
VFERAKPAASNANICEIDISVDDKRDIRPAAPLSQEIGQAKEAHGLGPQALQFGAVCCCGRIGGTGAFPKKI